MKFLLRPGWLVLTLVVFIFAALCYSLLAPWQFSRNNEREARNTALEASFNAPVRPLSEELPPGTKPSQDTEWRRTTVTGTYLPDSEMVARLRTVHGEPAFEVLTPLRTKNDTIVLVDRGYVRPDNHSEIPDYQAPPANTVTVTARIRADEANPQDHDTYTPPEANSTPQIYAVNSDIVGDRASLDLRSGYLQLDADQPGVLSALPLPALDSGPFFSYALQWLAFGTMAILGWLYFTVRELKPGGALATERSVRTKRKSVAEILAEDEEETDVDGEAADHAGPASGRYRSKSV